MVSELILGPFPPYRLQTIHDPPDFLERVGVSTLSSPMPLFFTGFLSTTHPKRFSGNAPQECKGLSACTWDKECSGHRYARFHAAESCTRKPGMGASDRMTLDQVVYASLDTLPFPAAKLADLIRSCPPTGFHDPNPFDIRIAVLLEVAG